MSLRSLALPLCLLGLLACAEPPARAPLTPRPQGMEEEEEGESGQAERREWHEAMHRAAPGVDWRAIEAANRRAATERRNRQQRAPFATVGSWNEVGSRNLAGSMFAVAAASNGADLYLGSALGGVFHGPKDGSAWTAIGDGVYGGAHHLGVIPPVSGAQDIVLRAVDGEMWRSADGGATWNTPAGLAGLGTVRRLLVLQDAAKTVLMVAKLNGSWRLWRSTDRGASFTVARILVGVADIWTPRDALGSVWLLETQRLYESTDGGLSFSLRGATLPFVPSDVRLGGHESSGGSTFSLALQHLGTWELWRTVNGGSLWTHVRDMPEMWSAFGTSITNANVIAYGGVELWVSYDGGLNFDLVNHWWEHPGNRQYRLHADIMGVFTVPDSTLSYGERWYVGTHAGVYESKTQLDKVNWITPAGLGVSQYYSTLTSRRDADYVHAGSQDQGYQAAVLGVPGSGGPWADFTELITGDYGHLSSSDGSHDVVYSDYPGFVLVAENEAAPHLSTVDFPAGFDGQWLPFMIADPEDADVFYILGTRIWRGERVGATSTWAYTQLSTKVFSPALTALAFSPLDPTHAWCVTSDGKIYTSTDRGVNWTYRIASGPDAHYFYGTSIAPSSSNVDEVWIGGAGYSTAPVKFSADGGVTWQDRRAGLPNTLVYGLCEAPDQSGRMYAAAETGAWEWDPASQTWGEILGLGAPLTTYWAVEAVPSRNLIRFDSYGRGIWDYAPGTPGFFPYGELRGAPNVLTMRASAPPRIGAAAVLTIAGAPPGAGGLLSICSAQAEVQELGGWRFVDTAREVARLPWTANAAGVASVNLQLPALPALVGQERFLQAAARDSRQPQGWALSHGLRALIGP